MDDELSAFLDRHVPDVTEEVVWGEQMWLRVAAYLSEEMPPLPYTTSARGIVLHNRLVLVQQDRDSRHIMPGGRVETDELPEDTLRREVGEETGWSVERLKLLGFMHFLHLSPKLPGYTYPYPDFIQVMFAAEAIAYSCDLKVDDGYEVASEFLPVAAARKLELTPKERMYLDAAVKAEGLLSP